MGFRGGFVCLSWAGNKSCRERVLRRTQQHNGRSDIGVMIAISNSDPLYYPAGVTDRGEDVNIGP